MEGDVAVEALDRDGVRLALPLIREAAPDMTLERLRAYVETLTRNGHGGECTSGILAARSPNGYIRGLATYRIVLSLCRGRTLVVDNFLVPGPLYNRMCADALLDALEALATRQHCAAIEAQPAPDDPEAGLMAQFKGYRFEGSRFCKTLDRGPSTDGGAA